MRTLTLVLVTLCAPLVRGDDRLNGTWTAIALLFAEPDVITIPLHGTSFDCKFDKSRSPNRLEMSFQEFGKNVWAYCIYDVKGDTLMMRMLLPIILTQDYVTDDARRGFAKEPYPKSFSTKKGDATVLLILRRATEKLPNRSK